MVAVTIRVRDRMTAGAARVVRIHRRDTGAVLAEGVSNGQTGLCALDVDYAGEVYCVVLDDAAGVLENDQIMRLMV